MGNACARSGAFSASDGAGGGGTLPVPLSLSDPRAYFDSLYGPADGSGGAPSPYHPHGDRPVRVPSLFQLALEQLCVSLVDQHSLQQLLVQQQRRRRFSLQPPAQTDPHRDADADSDGYSGAAGTPHDDGEADQCGAGSTPTTPLAAAVWATAAMHKGAAGATRRYSHADVLMQQQRLWAGTQSVQRAPLAAPHAAWCGPQQYGLAPAPFPQASPPCPPKRARSLSLSSKESPELQPQSFPLTAASTRSASLQHRSPTSPSMMSSYATTPSRGPASAGVSPVPTMLRAALHVPASPLVLGMSHSPAVTPATRVPAGSRSAQVGAAQVPPPLIRSLSDPLAPNSAPHPSTCGEFDPPELLLPPTHSSSVIHSTAGCSSDGHPPLNSQQYRDGHGLSTSALLAAGSMSVAVGSGNGFGRSMNGSKNNNSHRSSLHHQLRLPDLMVQLIFDRLVSEEMLTIDNIRLFTSAHLSSIDLSGNGGKGGEFDRATDSPASGGNSGKYTHEVTDEWMHVLFESVVQHYSTMQYACQQQQEERARAKQRLASQQVPTPAPAEPLATPADSGQRLAAVSLDVEERKEEPQPDPRVASGLASATSSPKLLAQTCAPHHGSIAHLSLERQQSTKSHHADGLFSPTSPTVAHAAPHSAPQVTRSLHAVETQSMPLSHESMRTTGAVPLVDAPLLSVHNPLSVTSPSPSLALYSHAPALTALNLSGCSQISNRALMPLQLCLMLRRLNLNGCTQISDELLMCVLQNKFFIESLQLKGLRSVTDLTLDVLHDKTQLRTLELDCCAVSDTGLQKLSALSQLERFSVGWCGKRVTEKGIEWIAHNFHLRSLCIAFTGVTSTSFFSHLRMLREVNVSGLPIADGGLKHSLFPHLRHAYMQRTRFHAVPAGLLHFHLHTLDMSFSYGVPSGKLAHQMAAWAECKPTQSSLAPASAAAAAAAASVPTPSAPVGTPLAPGPGNSGSQSTIAASSSSSQLASQLSSVTLTDASTSPESVLPGQTPLPQAGLSHSFSPSFVPPVVESVGSDKLDVPESLPLARGSDPSCIQVRRLWLEGCSVNNRVARVIGEHMRNLTSLNLADTEVANEGVQALAPLVRLRVLNLSGCKLTNAALGTIGSHFPQLLELHLDCPTVSDAGLALLRPLAPHLQRLDLFEAHVSDAGLEHLSGFVRLVALECCCGRITNKGVGAVGRHLPALTSLNLSHNAAIDDQGLEPLRGLRKLVHLNLSGTKVTHKGLAILTSSTSSGGSGSPGNAATAGATSAQQPSASVCVAPLQRISLFGCDVKATSGKLAQLPPGLQLGIDAGVLVVE